MSIQSKIVGELRRMGLDAEYVPPVGWHFVNAGQHYFYVLNDAESAVSFSIPHLGRVSDYGAENVVAAVGDTNRNVKFIKAVVQNGSISLDYDHQLTDGDNIGEIVPHIVSALKFAADYMNTKLRSGRGEKTENYQTKQFEVAPGTD